MTINIDAAENPRVVPSFPGNGTIRDPFGNIFAPAFTPSPRVAIPIADRNPQTFFTVSPACFPAGPTTKIVDRGTITTRCTARTAVTVDFPYCRVQFNTILFTSGARRNTLACASSGTNPNT